MKPLVIAHRGDSAHAPENTLAAFHQAVDKGCDWIETDLQLASDDVVLAFHDDTLRRLTGENGRVADHDAAHLTELRILSDRFAHRAGQTICTLQDVLEGPGASVPFYLELKSDGRGRATPRNARLIDAVLAQVPDHPHAIASFDADLVAAAADAGRRAVLIANSGHDVPGDLLPRLFAVSVRYTSLDRDVLHRWADAGIPVWAWTVDDPGAMRTLVRDGVVGICSNDVALARATLDGLE